MSWSLLAFSSADKALGVRVTGSDVQRRTKPASSFAPQPRSTAEKKTCSATEQRLAGNAAFRAVDVMMPCVVCLSAAPQPARTSAAHSSLFARGPRTVSLRIIVIALALADMRPSASSGSGSQT